MKIIPIRAEICSRIVAGLGDKQWFAMCQDAGHRGKGMTTNEYIVSECYLLADEIIKQRHKKQDYANKNNQ